MTEPTQIKGQLCEGCPRYESRRCGVSKLSGDVDVLFVAEQPDTISADAGRAVSGHGGRIIQTAIKSLWMKEKQYASIRYAFTYAAQCVSDDDTAPSKAILLQCQPYLFSTIGSFRPKVIVALGGSALKQLGFKQQYSEVRNKFLSNIQYAAPVYVSFSEKALMAAPGVFETFKWNLKNIFDRVLFDSKPRLSLEEIAQNYLTPKTIDDAIAACQAILEYRDPSTETAIDDWTISVDTETNTLHPEKDTSKIIAFCFGWGKGRAATILYDHPHAGEEYLARLPELWEWIKKVLQCKKPKIFHNAKFDLKFIELRYATPVNRVVWDTLLGEHLLDEDKKGNYGLKVLTANLLPDYCGYEDKLYDLLQDDETVSKVDETEKEIEDLAEALAEEHPEYLQALHDYKDALVAYEQEQATYITQKREYDLKLDDYNYLKSYLDGKQAAWNVEIQDWPKGKKGKPKKPTKWFSKPERPAAVKEPKKPDDPRSKKEQQISKDAGFENIPIHDLQIYGAVDGDVTRQLAGLQRRRIAEEKSKVTPLMRTHAIPASRVLGRMEYYGMRVDQSYIGILNEALTKIVDSTESELYSMAGHTQPNGKPLKLAGPGIANVLFNWGWKHPDGTAMDTYPILEKTKKGAASTSANTLRNFLKYEDDKKTIPTKEAYFVERLLRYRKAIKARDTFLVNVQALSKRDGFLHTQFHLNGTGTGRLSSSDMNMQNVPKMLSGWNLKKLFVPDDDSYVICNVDYKGAEVRVFTAYAKDKALIQALNDGMDMHSFFASKVFQRPYEMYENRDNADLYPDKNLRSLLDLERTQIKRVVFGILYGAAAQKISETIGVDEDRAQELIDLLYRMFPEIEMYAKRVEREVEMNGWVETHFGRRRRFPLAKVSRHASRAKRQARNFKIQSTSSDIVLGQLVEIEEPLRYDMGGRMLLTVHDSLVFQLPKKNIPQLKDFILHYAEKRVTEKYDWLPVPFRADIEIGPSYGECQSIPKYLAKHPLAIVEEGVLEEQELLTELRNDAFEAA